MNKAKSKTGISILNLSPSNARAFFLKSDSYCSVDFPPYFKFDSLIENLSKEIDGKNLKQLNFESPADYDGVNYKILSNKDSKFSWRPFELINPVLYIVLVNEITNETNWQFLQKKFIEFQANYRIECKSIPLKSSTKLKDKAAQIQNWWSEVEQKSISLALEYDYVVHTDIADFYPSIYTHSIAWAVHGKIVAKDRKFRTKKEELGNQIDYLIQSMSYGQTNGIPQGSALMDFVAEILLGAIDLELGKKLENEGITSYKILRYRDDYRIFSNDQSEAAKILKILTEILSDYGLKLNSSKTFVSNDVIRDSVKSDKLYALTQFKAYRNYQKHLMQIYCLSQKHPNSSSVRDELTKFYKKLFGLKLSAFTKIDVLISIAAEILVNNPKWAPLCTAILSKLIIHLPTDEIRIHKIKLIRDKLSKVPNTGIFDIWLQRMSLFIDHNIPYPEQLCKIVVGNKTEIWNCDWIKNKKYKMLLSAEQIIDEDMLIELGSEISYDEFDLFKY